MLAELCRNGGRQSGAAKTNVLHFHREIIQNKLEVVTLVASISASSNFDLCKSRYIQQSG